MKTSSSILATCVALVIGFVATLAGSTNNVEIAGMPIFAWAAIIAFLTQWTVFLPSWFAHSERFFDLTGSITYLTVVAFSLFSATSLEPYSLLIAAMVSLWAFRLGWFLSARVRAAGSDSRFDLMKHRFAWFFMTWTLQGLWVLLTAGAALAAIAVAGDKDVGAAALAGTALWAIGFGIEVTADEQKRRFRSKRENQGRFITSGLWARSRHPNYLGEIVLWTGVAIAALPVLSGWNHLTLVSPLFVWALLTRVSGIPLLEAAGDRRWVGDQGYEDYKAQTPVLMFKIR
jgi:steroid 5-alpha reductase family enzyme